jgi:phosphorylase kinase gamma subunit
LKIILTFVPIFSGISSVVRRCIEKETGKEYAAKIIDLGASDSSDSNQMLDSTRQEISILRQVMGHPYISELLTLI